MEDISIGELLDEETLSDDDIKLKFPNWDGDYQTNSEEAFKTVILNTGDSILCNLKIKIMNLLEQIKKDKMLATKGGQKLKAIVLSTLIGEIDRVKPKIVNGVKIIDDKIIIVIAKKMVENNKITKCEGENPYLECYIPEVLSESETEKIIDSIIVETGASTIKDMGRVMGIISTKYSTTIDGRIASNLTKAKLINGK